MIGTIIAIAIGLGGGLVTSWALHHFFGKELSEFFKGLTKQVTKVGRGYYNINTFGTKGRTSEYYSVGYQEKKREFGDYIREQEAKRKGGAE